MYISAEWWEARNKAHLLEEAKTLLKREKDDEELAFLLSIEEE